MRARLGAVDSVPDFAVTAEDDAEIVKASSTVWPACRTWPLMLTVCAGFALIRRAGCD
jgi:hypothetical protein